MGSAGAMATKGCRIAGECREPLELSARADLSAAAGRPISDTEWHEAAETLLAIFALLNEWATDADDEQVGLELQVGDTHHRTISA